MNSNTLKLWCICEKTPEWKDKPQILWAHIWKASMIKLDQWECESYNSGRKKRNPRKMGQIWTEEGMQHKWKCAQDDKWNAFSHTAHTGRWGDAPTMGEGCTTWSLPLSFCCKETLHTLSLCACCLFSSTSKPALASFLLTLSYFWPWAALPSHPVDGATKNYFKLAKVNN